MDLNELTEFHEDTAGEHHYIDVASRKHAVVQLRRWLQKERPVLADIGCSSGWMLDTLRHEFPLAFVLGADYVRGPLEKLARTLPGIPLLQFDLTSCPLPDESLGWDHPSQRPRAHRIRRGRTVSRRSYLEARRSGRN